MRTLIASLILTLTATVAVAQEAPVYHGNGSVTVPVVSKISCTDRGIAYVADNLRKNFTEEKLAGGLSDEGYLVSLYSSVDSFSIIHKAPDGLVCLYGAGKTSLVADRNLPWDGEILTPKYSGILNNNGLLLVFVNDDSSFKMEFMDVKGIRIPLETGEGWEKVKSNLHKTGHKI